MNNRKQPCSDSSQVVWFLYSIPDGKISASSPPTTMAQEDDVQNQVYLLCNVLLLNWCKDFCVSLSSNPGNSGDSTQVRSQKMTPATESKKKRASEQQVALINKQSTAETTKRVHAALLCWADAQATQATTEAFETRIRQNMPTATIRIQPRTLQVLTRLCATTAYVLHTQTARYEHIADLGVILHAHFSHAMPVAYSTKRTTDADTDVTLLVTSACRLALLTQWQALRGSKRQQHAVQRCRPLSSQVAAAILGTQLPRQDHGQELCDFLSKQLWTPLLKPDQHNAVLYQLASAQHLYIGHTKHATKTQQCKASSPCNRFYQHLQEIRTGHVSRYKQVSSTNKLRCFRNQHPADIHIWVLAYGPSPEIQALEATAIRTWRPDANDRELGTKKQRTQQRRLFKQHNRHRPPAHLRCRPQPLSRHTSWASSAEKMLRVRQQQDLHASRQAQQHQLSCKAFSHTYRHFQQQMVSPGPLDIANPAMRSLLVSWICDRNMPPDWESLLQRSQCNVDTFIDVARAMERLPKCWATGRGTRRINAILRRHHLPTTHKLTVHWPAELPLNLFHVSLPRILCEHHISFTPKQLAWMRSRARVTLQPPPKHSSKWNHIRTCKQASAAPPHREADIQQNDYIQHKLYWKLPVKRLRDQILGAAINSLRKFAKATRLRHSKQWQGWLRKQSIHPPTSPGEDALYDAYTTHMKPASPDAVLVQEDKDKPAAWRLRKKTYLSEVFRLLDADADHWLQVNGSASSVAEEHRQNHEQKLPKHRQYLANKQKWTHYSLPSMPCIATSKPSVTRHTRGEHVQQHLMPVTAVFAVGTSTP